jgi:hypothetical protein
MTKQSNRIIRSTTLLVIVLTLAGCKNACDVTEKPSPTPAATQLTGSGNSYVEITAAASAPTGSGPCKDGMILVSAGNGTQQLLMGHLQSPLPASFDLAGWNGTTWQKRGTGPIDPPPTGSTEAPEGSDSQTARLANGDLLLMWNGSTQSPLPNSSSLDWWNDWGTPGNVILEGLKPRFPTGQRDGYRAAQVIWRYSCAQGKWLETRMLDGGPAQGLDKAGQLKPGHCVKGSPWYRGFDRPELYVDPWGVNASEQRIYVSTRCSRPDDDDSTQVFMSPDTGVTWNPSGVRLGPGTPVVMTTTFNGRLLMLQPSGNIPALHWSDDNGASLSSPAGGYDVTYVIANPKPDEQARYELSQLAGDVTGVGHSNAYTLSLGRTGSNAALAVYPSVEKVKVNDKMIQRQVAAVVWVVTKGKDEPPIVVPIKIIRAQAPEGSVLMPSLIQDDRPDSNIRTNLIYWLETVSPPANATDPVKMLARYMTFTGVVANAEQLLSDAAGWEMNNRTPYKAMGDYMKGSFYAHNGNMNFVAVWPQVPPTVATKDKTQVYARIITLVQGDGKEPPQPETMPGSGKAPQASPSPTGKP